MLNCTHSLGDALYPFLWVYLDTSVTFIIFTWCYLIYVSQSACG